MYARHVWWMCRRGQAKPKFELVILTTLALAFWDKFWSSNRSPSRLLVDMSVYQDQAPQSRHLAILLYQEHTNKREGDLQSGAADRSLGFEDEDLRSSPGLLGQ